MSSNKRNVFLASRFEEFEDVRRYLNQKLSIRFNPIDLNDGKSKPEPALKKSLIGVRNCDLMILLLGETYSDNVFGEEQLSITHLEYREARKPEHDKMVFVFCIGDSYANCEMNATHPKLKQFQQELIDGEDGHIVRFFSTETPEDIAESISENIVDYLLEKPSSEESNFEKKLKNEEANEKRLKEEVIAALKQTIEIEALRNTALKYMPLNYINKMPKEHDTVIEELCTYGGSPLICTLSELFTQAYQPALQNYLDYLKNEKYPNNAFECVENRQLSERSFILLFSRENEKFNVEMWEHYNQEFIKRELILDKEEIALNKEDIQMVFESFNEYIEDWADDEVYVELVLPKDELAKGIHTWQYVTESNKERKIISRYKCILRMQERFVKYRNAWGRKWEQVSKERLLLDHNHIVISEKYSGEISANKQCVLGEKRIEEINDVLDDIQDSKISIAVLPLGEDADNKIEYNKIWDVTVVKSKDKICNFMRDQHVHDYSNLIFLFDDPTKIPQQYINPRENKLKINKGVS